MSAYHKDGLRPGTALAEYTIESILGHGGFGITYLARDTTLGAYVAIKEYLPQDVATRDTRTGAVVPRLSREAIRDYRLGLKSFLKEARRSRASSIPTSSGSCGFWKPTAPPTRSWSTKKGGRSRST